VNFGMLGRLLALTKRGVSGSTPVIPTAGRGCGQHDARSLSSSLTASPGSTSPPRGGRLRVGHLAVDGIDDTEDKP
jgi:hypothetical protein